MSEQDEQAKTQEIIQDNIEDEVNSLKDSTFWLRILAGIVTLVTIGHLFIALSPWPITAFYTLNKNSGSFLNSLSMFITFMVTFLIFLHIMIHRSGVASMKWIDDELHRFSQEQSPHSSVVNLQMNAKFAIRTFVETCGLPFVPERWGAGIYLSINIVLTVVGFVVIRAMMQ